MRITELFENTHFDSENYIKKTDDGNEIDYDLVDDLVFYLNNNDDVYRRCLLPAVHKFIDMKKDKKEPKYTIFKSAVKEGYTKYLNSYPIRELPDDIDVKIWKKACKKLFDEVSKDLEDGSYDHI